MASLSRSNSSHVAVGSAHRVGGDSGRLPSTGGDDAIAEFSQDAHAGSSTGSSRIQASLDSFSPGRLLSETLWQTRLPAAQVQETPVTVAMKSVKLEEEREDEHGERLQGQREEVRQQPEQVEHEAWADAQPADMFGASCGFDDGTLTFGPLDLPAETPPGCTEDVQEGGHEHVGVADKPSAALPVDSDAEDVSDCEPLDASLAQEPWMSVCSASEYALWDKARPLATRREAARIKSLRLPAAGVTRLMRLHPGGIRGSDATEVANYATVLVVQAVARAAARSKSGGRITFEDVRAACLQTRELQFLLPLQASLDTSAVKIGRDAGGAGGDAAGIDGDEEVAAPARVAAKLAPQVHATPTPARSTKRKAADAGGNSAKATKVGQGLASFGFRPKVA